MSALSGLENDMPQLQGHVLVTINVVVLVEQFRKIYHLGTCLASRQALQRC